MLRGENWESISDGLLDLESRAGFFDVRVRGVPVWERVRFRTHLELVSKSEVQGELNDDADDSSSRIKLYADRGVKTLTNLLHKNPYISSQKDVVVLGHPRRKRLSDGYWWDIYCDPIYSEIDLDYLHLEKSFFNDHFQPPKTTNVKYLDSVINIANLARKARSTFSGLTDEELETISYIDEQIEDEFGVETTAAGKARTHLKLRPTLKRLYRGILRITQPEVVIVLVSYSNQIFIEACKSLGIPVAELQHGVVYPRHFGYSFPGDRPKESFPDYFLTWGDFWNERVEFPLSDEKVVTVGYPFLEREYHRYSDVESSDRILFISQGSIGVKLSEFASELAEMVQSEVAYKLHPREYDNWRDKYPHLEHSDVTVIGQDGPQLYQLFAESSVQVGVYSTAIYEGLMFDLDTYLVALPGVKSMEPLTDSGYAEKVDTPRELVNLLGKDSPVSSETDQREEIRHIFERDPVTNIESFLTEFVR